MDNTNYFEKFEAWYWHEKDIARFIICILFRKDIQDI